MRLGSKFEARVETKFWLVFVARHGEKFEPVVPRGAQMKDEAETACGNLEVLKRRRMGVLCIGWFYIWDLR